MTDKVWIVGEYHYRGIGSWTDVYLVKAATAEDARAKVNKLNKDGSADTPKEPEFDDDGVAWLYEY